MKKYEFVKVQIDDHIMSVTINRPEVYNAVHPPLSLELNEIWDNFDQDKDNYFAGMLLAQNLNKLKNYDQTINLLKDLKILPYEHATEGRKIYTDAYVGSALQSIIKGDPVKATKRLNTSLLLFISANPDL